MIRDKIRRRLPRKWVDRWDIRRYGHTMTYDPPAFCVVLPPDNGAFVSFQVGREIMTTDQRGKTRAYRLKEQA